MTPTEVNEIISQLKRGFVFKSSYLEKSWIISHVGNNSFQMESEEFSYSPDGEITFREVRKTISEEKLFEDMLIYSYRSFVSCLQPIKTS